MTSSSDPGAGPAPRRGVRRKITAGLAAVALIPLGVVGAQPFLAHAEQNSPAIHYVVDVSGSMAGERLANAVAAIKQSAASVPDSTALGLRSYAGGCDQSSTPPAVPIATGNDAAIDTAADGLVASGGTPTTAALGEGFKELQAYPSTGPKRLVLLTDGDTQCGVTICDYVKQNLPAGVQLQLYTVGLQVSDTAATDLTCAAQSTGGAYIPAQQPSDLADALAQASTGTGRSCAQSGAGGWRMSAHISDNDGLVLDESAFGGRVFSKQISAPYLEGIYRHNGVPGLDALIELTPTRDKAHPAPPGQPLYGSTLQSFECGKAGDDIYAKAVYAVDDFVAERRSTGPLTVTQEYRFRGIDAAHPCEPTEKLSCARFWPSLSFHYADASTCSVRSRTCTMFTAMRTVQRMALRPDDKLNGGIDAYRDTPSIDKDPGTIKTKGSRGAMKYEDTDTAIRNGSRGDWDSIHQAPGPKTSGPGVLSPGCGECVHMHWAWSRIVDLRKFKNFTDGKPQLREGSKQDAEFGVVRLQDGEEDPYAQGWRSLVDKKKKAASELSGHTPIIFWEMTSYARDDATFPILDNYRHGGNGAIFFGG